MINQVIAVSNWLNNIALAFKCHSMPLYRCTNKQMEHKRFRWIHGETKVLEERNDKHVENVK